jgi:signal transduction histidine kinase
VTPRTTADPAPARLAARRRRGLRGLTVQAWFLLALLTMGVVDVVAGAAGTAALNRTERANAHLVDGIAPARAEAFQLQAALLDQETGVRGYLLTGDRALLEPYHRGLAAEEGIRGRLTGLIGDAPGPSADLARVERAARTWRTEFAEPAIRAEETRTPYAHTAGKAAFDEVRAAVDAQQQRLQAERERGRAELAEARDRQDLALAVILGAFLVTAAGLAALIHYAVGRPLTAVRLAAERVADGDFTHHIPGRGPADLQALTGSVEAMRERIVEELDTSRRNEAVLVRQAADLEEQRIELERSNAELEQFAYVASHDLQEPLRKIASFCQLLEKRYGDRLDERGTQYIAFAVDGAKRMQVLINDLLTFSRVGRLHDRDGTVELDETLDRAVRDLSVSVADSGAEIVRPGPLPAVQGDPTLYTMLWQNLVGNAVKFRSPDRPPRIVITAEFAVDEGGTGIWTFAVTDNGIGIPSEFAEKVFVIFQRLHSRDVYSGTGIGLSLCKKIVEHNGGRIRVDEEYTGGTRIVFTLPGEAAAAPDTAPGAVPGPSGPPAEPARPADSTGGTTP